MDLIQGSDSSDLQDQDFVNEASVAVTGCITPEPCQPQVSHYLKWNSGELPHLISANRRHSDKRKKVLVTMEEKLKALQRLDAGDPLKIIAEELGVGKSTISDWKKHRNEIEKWYANQAGASCIKVRKTMRKGKHALVEQALYYWFEFVRSKGFHVSGPILQQKALQLKTKIEGEEGEKFTASEGWLDRWKKRFGISTLSNLIVDQNGEEYLEELKKDLFELGNIKAEQIYCCGRVSFNYRLLPTNILGSKEHTDAGPDIKEELLIILPCCNATGSHKLRLSFIGKSEKFQSFDTIKDNELLPFWYSQQTGVWLDGRVLKAWFENEFVPAVEKHLTLNELPRKAVLIVTNYPSFMDLRELQDGDIKVVFVPMQAAQCCQPMNQGIIEWLKKKYWCRLLSSVISTSTDRKNCMETLKNVEIIEAIQFASEAWDEIPSWTLAQSWKELINQEEHKDWAQSENQEVSMANDDKELAILLNRIIGSDDVSSQDVNEWLANEEEDEMVSEDIVAMILREPQHDLDHLEENSVNNEEPTPESIEVKMEPLVLDEDCCVENIPPPVKRVRHSEGLKALTKALDYVSQQEEVTPEDIVWLLKWREIAARKSLQEGKQKKSVKSSKLF